MNQLLLFLRSIAISILVFLVLAFFAAKIFGGTLFPKPPRVDFPAVAVGGHSYFLSVTREAGKTPAFSLRQIDATDSGNSVLVAPQSNDDAAAWAWAELVRMPGVAGMPELPGFAGTATDAGIAVKFTQRDGRTGMCSVDSAGKMAFKVD